MTDSSDRTASRHVRPDAPGPRIALQIEKNRAHGRALLQGIADYALAQTDWRLELVGPERLTDPDYVSQFDGLIVRVMDNETARTLADSRKPVVDTYGRAAPTSLSCVCLDDTRIAEMAFQALAQRHYLSFAFCGFPGLRFSDARGKAFADCAQAAGFGISVYAGNQAIGDTFFRDEKTEAPDADALARWLASLPRPTALFCCNDLRALHVLNTCAACGIAVPRDLAVLGVDNDVLLCTFAHPSLSSVDTNPIALGRTAAELLHRQLRTAKGGRRSPPVTRLHPPQQVIERLSTDAYPFRTSWLADALRFIRRNITQGVTATDVIRHVGYSSPTVNAAFVAELGHTVKHEIQSRRLDLACSLLEKTNQPAGAIALACGYRSPQYFSAAFTRAFKTTPDRWRKTRAFQKP